ncbi:MAG: hypothetical protein AAGD13_07855 [Pseudomonadota bacterium]
MRGSESTFWPDGGPSRWRFALAFLLAPLALGSVIVLAAFLIAGMSETTSDGVIQVTLEAALTLVPMLVVFMLTFGAAGVAILWWLGQRGIFAWVVCGALSGTISSLLLGELLLDRVERPMLIAAAIGGWILFMLFRWIAGIRDRPGPAD